MKKLILLAALAGFACQGAPSPVEHVAGSGIGSDVMVFHDADRHVTCWSLSDSSGVAISCLPDKSFKE